MATTRFFRNGVRFDRMVTSCFYLVAEAVPHELFDPERMRELACGDTEELSCESLGLTEDQCTRLESMGAGLVELAVAEQCDVPPPEKPLFPMLPGSRPQAPKM